MPLINGKVDLSLRWIENCVLTTAAIGNNADASGTDSITFKITDAKRYVPIVTLLAEDNAKLSKLLGKGFKGSIYWNKYKVINNKVVKIAANNEEKYIRELLDSNYQGVKRLFVLPSDNTADDNNQVSINSFKKYFLPRVKIENDNIEIHGRNFYDHPINDSDADSRAIQQIIFTGKIKSTVVNTRVIIYYILEQSKETILKFSKRTTKLLYLHING